MNDEEQVKRCFQCPSLKMSNGVLKCSRNECTYEPKPKPKEIPDKRKFPTWSEDGFRALDYIKKTEKHIGKGKRAIAVGLGIFILEQLASKNKK